MSDSLLDLPYFKDHPNHMQSSTQLAMSLVALLTDPMIRCTSDFDLVKRSTDFLARSNAEADEAEADHVANTIVSQLAKYHYGKIANKIFDHALPDHAGRPSFTGPDGISRLKGGWSSIVEKVIFLVLDRTSFR